VPSSLAADLERIETEALATMYGAAPRSGRGSARCERVAGATLLAFPESERAVITNRVLGLGVAAPVRPGALDRVVGAMSAMTNRFVVALAPQAMPGRLYDDLLARGFEPGYGWMKFRRDVRPVPLAASAPVSIRPVEPEDADRFAAVVGAGFDTGALLSPCLAALPTLGGWRCLLAWNGDEPVGAGAMYVSGDTAWLGLAATLPAFRGRGVQSALLSVRVREARDRGVRTLVTETGERRPGLPDGSYRNLLRAGFEEAYVRPNLVSPALAGASTTSPAAAGRVLPR
jgi:GNAT superfamily N-acetyltransferase